ncbi:endonuclease/exonuclease/phosphatase family protein [Nocardioides sp. TF02-7]|uniref:endonuclease/exonuclease/phosphatase family protein n=1 Tax=Nocardioides sp. TF02-7 TaxID=2917724 RepID=UPI001F05A507|nr:endonuclease/exonuclease/phosphatase family protein [Nocardioides sp. TF02-7]UMG92074.1 hypothetical protein MF408_19210 [Nocardioides sp. TF02-7]
MAVAATIDCPSGPLTVATTHLSFVNWWNGRQLRHLVSSLASLPAPMLVTGDLNMGVDRAERVSGMTAVARHPTFPADAPREQLDHVLADRRLEVRSQTCRMPLSDHLALVVDLV